MAVCAGAPSSESLPAEKRAAHLDEDWPDGIREIARRECPHPGVLLRSDDIDGYRLTAFATNMAQSQLADLEAGRLRHARCEDWIRSKKDTGLQNLPLASFAPNRVLCQNVALASEIMAWTGLLDCVDQPPRRWEPKRVRYRLFQIPATITRYASQQILHLLDRSLSRSATPLSPALPAPAG